jgi:hypothetical protein
MPNLLKFFCFFLLFAVIAGRGETIITEPRGNLLLFHHVIKTDSLYYDSKNIPLAAAKEAFEKDSGVFTVFERRLGNPFGLTIKSISQTKKIAKVGNRLETKINPAGVPPSKKFNLFFIPSFLTLLILSFMLGWLSSLKDRRSWKKILEGVMIFSAIQAMFSSVYAAVALSFNNLCDGQALMDFFIAWVYFFAVSLVITFLFSIFFHYREAKKKKKKQPA